MRCSQRIRPFPDVFDGGDIPYVWVLQFNAMRKAYVQRNVESSCLDSYDRPKLGRVGKARLDVFDGKARLDVLVSTLAIVGILACYNSFNLLTELYQRHKTHLKRRRSSEDIDSSATLAIQLSYHER